VHSPSLDVSAAFRSCTQSLTPNIDPRVRSKDGTIGSEGVQMVLIVVRAARFGLWIT
jgi:hypothetical protein